METHVIHYTPCEFTHHSGPLMRCYVRAKQRSLLGSFSGFNKVSLLQTLEAVHEHAALWLWSRNITQREIVKTKPCDTNVTLLSLDMQFPRAS